MAGARTLVLLAIMAMAAAVTAPYPQQPMQLQLVETSSGLRVMRHEVSVADWKRCVDEGACSHMPKAGPGVADDQFPVTSLNWFDVKEYVAWAQARSGLPLRVPTLAEWRAMSGIMPKPRSPLFTDPRLAWAADYGIERKVDPALRPPGGFGATAAGIADVKGNVWEWTSTCASEGAADDKCPAYLVAGEHEAAISVFVRDPAIGGCTAGFPPAHLGLRLVIDQRIGD